MPSSLVYLFVLIAANLLVIESVRESDLGIYQCVVRSLTPSGSTDEWVSASAVLALEADKIVSKGDAFFMVCL